MVHPEVVKASEVNAAVTTEKIKKRVNSSVKKYSKNCLGTWTQAES